MRYSKQYLLHDIQIYHPHPPRNISANESSNATNKTWNIKLKNKVVSVHDMKAYGEVRSIHAVIFNIHTRWGWVVIFKTRSLYTWGQIPRYPWKRRFGVLHSRSGLFGGEKNIRPSQQLNHDPSAVQPVVSTLYLLRYLHSYLDPIIAKLVFCSKCTWNEVLTGSQVITELLIQNKHFMYIQYHIQFISSRMFVSLHFYIILYVLQHQY